MENPDAGHEAMGPSGPTGRVVDRCRGLCCDFAALLALTVVSLGVGCLINAFRAKPLPWAYRSRSEALTAAVAEVRLTPTPPTSIEVERDVPHEIRLDEFQSFVAEHRGLVVDARPAVFYRDAHVPGAVSLPREAFAEEYPRVRATLERFKDRPIVIYCSGADCPDSQLLTDALTKLGYRHLLIYTSGWDEWSQTGLPEEGLSAPP